MSSVTKYIVLSKVGSEGGFSDIVGICKNEYDATVARGVDMDTYGTEEQDYMIVPMEIWK